MIESSEYDASAITVAEAAVIAVLLRRTAGDCVKSGCEIVENRFLHITEFGFDLDQRSGALLDGGVRVLETVAGQREDYADALNGGQESPFRNN